MLAIDICRLFNTCFEASYHTRLLGGAGEPLYQPGSPRHLVMFREDYASSALHEIAHWCIAGAARREQPDYGYWYQGERDARAQRTFERVEVRPQALERIFSEAAGVPFRLSCDNFNESTLQLDEFRREVHAATLDWLGHLPDRAAQFLAAVTEHTGNDHALEPATYQALPR